MKEKQVSLDIKTISTWMGLIIVFVTFFSSVILTYTAVGDNTVRANAAIVKANENEKAIIRLQADMEHVKDNTDKILEKLDK